MKLATFILIISLTHASAAVYSQQINLDETHTPLKIVLKKIASQSGYRILYGDELLKNAADITLKLNTSDVENALRTVLEGQTLTYVIREKTIILQRKEPTFFEKLKAAITNINVAGHILDEHGQPIAGATISEKGTNNATRTDKTGYFSLSNVADKATLVITFVGYETKEVPALPNIGNIKLTISVSRLDETQVIAYGKTSQRLSTGDVTVISGKDIAQQPVSNPLLALEGNVPGLRITQVNGLPGSGISIAIRGQNSIAGTDDPLYIIDGVPYPSQLLAGSGYVLGLSSSSNTSNNAQPGNPLSYINPTDIESISVLKDADATAIYGSRGANGVILITTRKGKTGQSETDLTVQSGYSAVTRHADLLHTDQYLEMRREALKNDGITPSLANGDYDLLQWDTTRYTNWQKALIGSTAHYTDLRGSVSGGNELTTFLISGDYKKQTTVFPGDFNDQIASMHFNINNTSPNKKFTISLTGSYSIDKNLLPTQDFTYYAYTLAPDAPPLYNADGTLNWAPTSSGTSTWTNPLAASQSTYLESTNTLTANAGLNYLILPGLNLSGNFGYNNLQSNENTIYPLTSEAPEYRATDQNTAGEVHNNIHSWIIEPNLDYKRTFGKGKLDLLLGSTFQQNNNNSESLESYGYSSIQQIGDLSAAARSSASTNEASIYKYNALYGRINYNWNDEYLINLTARRDGSSRFGVNNEVHGFEAAGVAWIFTKEAIFKKQLPFLSFGKIRASYGSTGSDGIGNYGYLSLYNSVRATVPYQGVTSLAPAGLYNPNLEWELTRKLEVELDAGFLKDRILLYAVYNRDRSSNELLAENLPYLTGFTGISINLPATVQNTSWEFTLNTINVKSADFSWTSNFNITIPHNKLLGFPGLANSNYANQLVLGQPLDVQKFYHFEGVDPATGQYVFASKTDKFNPDYFADRTVLIDFLPKFYGGFRNTISYKGFSLDFLFMFDKKIGINDLFSTASYDPPGTANVNQFTNVLNRWQKPGDLTTTQRYNSNSVLGYPALGDAESSDAAYSNAAYIRLKNLAFSWQVNNNWTKKMRLKNLKLFIQGQNLLTITGYKGIDPESLGGSTLPPLKTLTGGIQVGL